MLSPMTTEQIIGLSIALFLMFLGVAGSIVPGLPSTPFVLVGAFGHKFYFGETGAAGWVLGVLLAFTALSLVVDYLASMYGGHPARTVHWRGSVRDGWRSRMEGCLKSRRRRHAGVAGRSDR